jgi:hypothetical protein
MSANEQPKSSRRRPLSCQACRHHKLRCDRRVPCGSCIRYRREDRCRAFPARPSVVTQPTPHTLPTAGSGPPTSIGAVGVPGRRSGLANVNASERESDKSSRQPPSSALKLADWRPSGFLSDPYVQAKTTIPTLGRSVLDLFATLGSQTFWKHQICQIIPSQPQCDVMLSYFFEHVNWIFQTVHVPTFRGQVSLLWQRTAEDLDLIWVALLLQMISLSALYIPFEAVELLGVERGSIRKLAGVWYQASRHALTAGGSMNRPTLIQLQVFSIAQLYWYATNDIEMLNSNMAQAIRNAQALGIDKDVSPASSVGSEMRHRLWWDLVDSDTFQSICLGRPPLIQVGLSNVPYPLNANDADLDEAIVSRPLTQPTQNSMNVYRAKFFELVNGHLCSAASSQQSQSYEQVTVLDKRLTAFMDDLPWYLGVSSDGQLPDLPIDHKFLFWQSHILRTCICTQVIRLYQPYLAQPMGNARARCTKAITDMLAVYKILRSDRSPATWQKFFPQAYQIFSMAVTMAALALVDVANFKDDLLDDVMMLASDLETLEEQGCSVTVAIHGSTVIKKILSFVQRQQVFTKADSDALTHDISIILGGEVSTRSYLNQTPDTQPVAPRRQPTIAPQSMESPTVLAYGDMDVFSNEALDQTILAQIDASVDDFDYQNTVAFEVASADLLGWDLTGFLNQGLDGFE